MITTYKGRVIDVFDLSIDDISIADAVIALPNLCRFGGRIKTYYSVAQHAVELSRWLTKNNMSELAPLALLHDACEAYIGDIIYPIKVQFPQFLKLEEQITYLFYKKYDVDKKLHNTFDYYDKNIVVNEMKAVGLYESDKSLISYLDELPNLVITPWSREKAKVEYSCELLKVFNL